MFKFKRYAKHNFFSRIEFAEFFIDKCNQSDEFFQNVLWTDEAHFYLEGNVSNRNFVIWDSSNPHATNAIPLHSERLTV